MMHESEGSSEHHCCCASPQIRLLWAERHKTWLSALLLLKKQGILGWEAVLQVPVDSISTW